MASAKKDWTGTERFEAIQGVLGTIIPARESIASGRSQADQLSLDSAVNAAISGAARNSGASEQQISDWVEAFSTFGRSGLSASLPAEQEACVRDVGGTWELESRYVDGEQVAASGYIYYDTDVDNLQATQLVTMWTEDPSGADMILLGLVDLSFAQNGPFKVDVAASGEFVGSFGGQTGGQGFAESFSLVRHGHNEAMLGARQATPVGGGEFAFPYVVGVTGDPGALVFTSLGRPATEASPRTPDVVDTYIQVSKKKPLVGGLEPVSAYFERARAQFQGASNGAALASFR